MEGTSMEESKPLHVEPISWQQSHCGWPPLQEQVLAATVLAQPATILAFAATTVILSRVRARAMLHRECPDDLAVRGPVGGGGAPSQIPRRGGGGMG